MRTVLVFPPEWRLIKQPYLSLPTLTAYLREQGCWVRQRDLNFGFHEYASSLQGLAPLHAWATERFCELDRSRQLNPNEQWQYAVLTHAAVQPLELFAQEMTWSAQVLRSKKDFYDLKQCWQAFYLQDKLWDLPRAMLTDTTAATLNRARYPEYSSARSLALAEDNSETRNPYLGYLSRIAVPEILNDVPNLVGISLAASGQIIPALTLARLLKERRPDLHITVGGNICTLLQRTLPSRPELFRYLDSVIIYEGEAPLLDLVRRLDADQDWRQVPSLLCLDQGQLRANPVAPALDMNLLPTPDFDDLPLERYQLPEILLPLLSSRDCYWKRCAFCSQSQAYTAYRRRAGRLVVEDMERLADRYHTAFFSFSDQSMAAETLAEISDGLVSHGRAFHWHCLSRLDGHWTRELCKRAAAAGCDVLTFGFETASERLSRLMNKGIDHAVALRVLRDTTAAGILNRLTVFFGFPSETTAEAEETIAFIQAHSDIIHAVVSQSYDLGALSPVAENPEHYQVQLTPDPDEDIAVLYENYHVPVGMTRAESACKSRKLWRMVTDRFPAFAASYLIELPLYVVRFQSYDRLVRLVRDMIRPRERHRDGQPRKRNGIQCVKLNFDLTRILATGEPGANLLESLTPEPSYLVVDCRRDWAMRVSPLAWQVLRMADGRTDVPTIAKAVASQAGGEQSNTQAHCERVLDIYQSVLG